MYVKGFEINEIMKQIKDDQDYSKEKIMKNKLFD